MREDGPIVFVIGAGASSEVDIPVGNDLRNEIAKLLNVRSDAYPYSTRGDECIVEAMRNKSMSDNPSQRSIGRYVIAAQQIDRAMPQAASIANFLDAHGSNENLVYCGKLAIVRAILGAERASKLFLENQYGQVRVNFDVIDGVWFSKLWRKLVENCSVEQFALRLKNAVFIVFNYDRCLEHFLHASLQNYYGVDEKEATEILKNLRVFHPYGKTGNLPWEGAGTVSGFGGDVAPEHLNRLAEEIKTFTEGTDPDSSEISEIRKAINDAGAIVFLGFAYLPSNIKLIAPDGFRGNSIRQINIYGTAVGISDSDCRVISSELATSLRVPEDRVFLRNDRTCSDLFGEFGRGITFV